MKQKWYGIEIILLGIVLFAVSGCGYKGPPTYEKKVVPQEHSIAL